MSIATALAAEKAYYSTQAALLTNALAKVQADSAIEIWYTAAVAQATEDANAVQSYTIAGRSVTRRATQDGAKAVTDLKSKIMELLYCGPFVSVDLSSSADKVEP